jgi:hypothetical protein
VIPRKHLVATLSLVPILTWAQMKAEERVIRLQNQSAEIVVNIAGGAIADLRGYSGRARPREWKRCSACHCA